MVRYIILYLFSYKNNNSCCCCCLRLGREQSNSLIAASLELLAKTGYVTSTAFLRRRGRASLSDVFAPSFRRKPNTVVAAAAAAAPKILQSVAKNVCLCERANERTNVHRRADRQ